MEEHDSRVALIASKIRQFHTQKVPWRVYHGGTHSTRKTSLQRSTSVDTSHLSHVLKICTTKMTALVEPNVSMESLVRETLRHGLLPPVVPEFPGITVGGGFAGMAAESSSFKYGFLDNTVNWIEIVLADGSVTKSSRDLNSDLFYGAAGTFGTLGVTTLLELKLVQAKAFIQLTYLPVNSVCEAINQTKKATEDPANDFVDGILFKQNQGVVITGRLVEEPRPDASVRSFGQARDEWYYLHVEQLLIDTTAPKAEAIPIQEYLFRYDRGAFWTGRYVFTYFAVPFTRFMRWAFDSLLHTTILYHGLHESGLAKENIIQDIVLPMSQVQKFVEWLDASYAVYPLWLCPLRQSDQKLFYPPMAGALAKKKGHISWEKEHSIPSTAAKENPDVGGQNVVVPTGQEILMNVGVWGPRLPNPAEFLAANRELEGKVRELGGMKWLYAHCHYTKEEFWNIYDKEWYDGLRAKYHAEYLPSVYDKTRFDWHAEHRAIKGSWLRWLFSFVWWIWPMPGIYSVLCVWMQSDYLSSQ